LWTRSRHVGHYPLPSTHTKTLTPSQDNGGRIVLLEKLADILIADHARKDVPASSVSWKYVNDSVANGALVNIEDYRIHHANVPRPVGSAIPARATKVPYTALDEQILVTWVRQQERAGEPIRGNEIYKSLAELVRSFRNTHLHAPTVTDLP
jgi:hypothetical protein